MAVVHIDPDVGNYREFQAETVMDRQQFDINARVRIASKQAAGRGEDGSILSICCNKQIPQMLV